MPARVAAFDNHHVPLHTIEKTSQIITTEWKTYHISSTESISLYGAKRRKFIDQNWYWGEAGYGALTGKRSGYLEGGVIFGFMHDSMASLSFDYRLFFGAGGGGAAPQGGGLIIHPTVGIGTHLNYKTRLFFELGYIHFINGDISSPTMAVNINFYMWRLFTSNS